MGAVLVALAVTPAPPVGPVDPPTHGAVPVAQVGPRIMDVAGRAQLAQPVTPVGQVHLAKTASAVPEG
jgi:hypothetical protein